ncbi:hypothetical protein ACFDR9_004226 [Janthinobacterium sp. CG_23.3]|uniref:hypothetical protein n=1 Tax=unclassified Janthinobacterium TaxID=2610881 RepID=UPI00034A6166|nr:MULTISPECIES: hypothetical protein [unclassified Janthinobacterium]MEC5163799.1 hypothetical protein [Janthinobacterium sp. CG_S6]
MSKDAKEAALAAHKKRLIAEGEFYRVGIVHARASVAHALHPQALLHGAVEHMVGYAGARVDTLLAPGGLGWKAATPYILPALTFIARKKIIKPALGVGVLVAAAVGWLVRRKRRTGVAG